MKIRVTWKSGEIVAELNDTEFSKKLREVLPLEAEANTWGEEVYFRVPVKSDLDRNARDVVDPGTVCFWVEGQSLAIPFGPTPVSKEKECRLVTKVNILGSVEGDARKMRSIRDGDLLKIQTMEGNA